MKLTVLAVSEPRSEPSAFSVAFIVLKLARSTTEKMNNSQDKKEKKDQGGAHPEQS